MQEYNIHDKDKCEPFKEFWGLGGPDEMMNASEHEIDYQQLAWEAWLDGYDYAKKVLIQGRDHRE